MDGLFLTLFNMSVTATYLAVAVIILRLFLRRAPKWISVAMWALVGIRLVCPFSFESSASMVPSAETVPQDIIFAETPAINSGIYAVNSIVNPVLAENFTPTTEAASINPIQIFLFLAEIIWIVGIAAMLIYTAISYAMVYRKVREAVPLQDNVWLCDRISSPFILGVIRPRIYLPSSMREEDMEYVLSHERAHIRRRDHWFKPLGFLILSVYWFNPVLWVAYILLCRDIELACDERVIKEMGTEIKKAYSDALINCAAPRRYVTACPLAFGEVGVKTRIKSVLSYKKPAFWVIAVALILCVVLAVGFLTNPRTTVDDELSVLIDCQIAEHNQSSYSEGHACCVSWEVLGIEKTGNETTVYMWALYEEYSMGSDGKLRNETGSHIPTAVTAKKVDGAYQLVEYWIPRDGTYWANDIMGKFPPRLWREATDSQRYIAKQKAECEKMAREYFANNPDKIAPEGEFFDSTEPLYIQSLKAKYPEYFGLGTAKGLEVYWYQMAENNYNWVLLQGKNMAYTWQDVIGLPPATTGEMRAIVDYYNLPRTEVSVTHMPMPHSSYMIVAPDLQEYYREVEKMFWNTVPMSDTNFALPSYGSLVFDIDKDGAQEIVTLGYGMTSGVFSFSISASYNGEQKYRDYFISPHCAPQFLVRSVDDVCVMITAQAEKGQAEVAVLYEISVVDGHIVLTAGEEANEYFEVTRLPVVEYEIQK